MAAVVGYPHPVKGEGIEHHRRGAEAIVGRRAGLQGIAEPPERRDGRTIAPLATLNRGLRVRARETSSENAWSGIRLWSRTGPLLLTAATSGSRTRGPSEPAPASDAESRGGRFGTPGFPLSTVSRSSFSFCFRLGRRFTVAVRGPVLQAPRARSEESDETARF